MRTRNDIPVIERYVLVDTTHPQIQAARDDLRMLHRKLAPHLKLSVRFRNDNKRAIVKITLLMSDELSENVEKLQTWWSNRSWKNAVIAISADRNEVRDFIAARPAWQDEESLER